MKLILTQEVTGLGLAGDIVEVKAATAATTSLPRGLAIQSTKGAEKQIATIRGARAAREVRDLGHARRSRRPPGRAAVRSHGARPGSRR